jgi:hypothetical protein
VVERVAVVYEADIDVWVIKGLDSIDDGVAELLNAYSLAALLIQVDVEVEDRIGDIGVVHGVVESFYVELLEVGRVPWTSLVIRLLLFPSNHNWAYSVMTGQAGLMGVCLATLTRVCCDYWCRLRRCPLVLDMFCCLTMFFIPFMRVTLRPASEAVIDHSCYTTITLNP